MFILKSNTLSLLEKMMNRYFFIIFQEIVEFRFRTILIKLGSFDAFLHKMKESVRKNVRTTSRTEILSVKVDDYRS